MTLLAQCEWTKTEYDPQCGKPAEIEIETSTGTVAVCSKALHFTELTLALVDMFGKVTLRKVNP